jgi:hypothetical protein
MLYRKSKTIIAASCHKLRSLRRDMKCMMVDAWSGQLDSRMAHVGCKLLS